MRVETNSEHIEEIKKLGLQFVKEYKKSPTPQELLNYYIKYGSEELVKWKVEKIKEYNRLGYNIQAVYKGEKL